MNSEKKKDLAQNTFDEVIDFYNQNEKAFINFENKTGINLWFLNHFRTYFFYRNFFFNKEKTIQTTTNTNVHFLTKIKRLFLEFFYMLIKYKTPKKETAQYLIVSNSINVINGEDKQLGNLKNEFKTLYNRPLFNIKEKKHLKKFDHKDMPNTDSIFLNYLLKFSFLADLKKIKMHFDILIKEISAQTISNEKYDIILNFLKSNRAFFYIIFLRFKSLDIYFKNSNIKGILLSDENSPQQKVFQYAANRNNIKTFGFQHGNIHSLHPAYIYKRYNTKPLLPTITFTWGSFFSDVLIKKGGYPADKVKTVGKIPTSAKKAKVNPLINPKDNIILYASQPNRDAAIRYNMLKDILLVMKELNNNYKLIIRPHHNETDDVFFNKVANDVGFNNIFVDRKTDLKSHLEICNILIVAFSTVGTEFIPYYKPLLVLDYLNQDLINWIKEGVGIPIKNRNDLINELSKKTIKIDKNKYDNFIKKYYITGNKVLDNIKKEIYDKKHL